MPRWSGRRWKRRRANTARSRPPSASRALDVPTWQGRQRPSESHHARGADPRHRAAGRRGGPGATPTTSLGRVPDGQDGPARGSRPAPAGAEETIFPTPDTVELADASRELSLCLALVREGMSSTSRALAYLSYWKAIEVAIGDPRHQSWIGPAAAALWPEAGRTARPWYKRLNETRFAAAHALPRGKGLRYHPDDPALTSRLREDVDRMRQLAMKAIGERWPSPVRVKGSRY